jgi:hypothetical protein
MAGSIGTFQEHGKLFRLKNQLFSLTKRKVFFFEKRSKKLLIIPRALFSAGDEERFA